MPGLVPGIHVFLHATCKDVDGRDKPGHDAGRGGGVRVADDWNPSRFAMAAGTG